MADIKVREKVDSTINGSVVSYGDINSSVTVTAATGGKLDAVFPVADAGTQKIFDVADDLADFDYLRITSDQTVEAEFVVGNGGGSEVMFVLEIVANLPFHLGSDASRLSDHTEDWGADGTADTIDKITIKNSSGSTANVHVLAAT